MIIEIRKYKKRDGSNAINNYFDRPNLIDSIILTEVHEDGFPIFNEEFENEFETFSLLSSDFDLRFSLLQENFSKKGKTIEQFFQTDISIDHCLVAKIQLDEKVIGGIIDLSRIEIDYSFPTRYDVKITMFSIENEFNAFCQGKLFQPLATVNYLNNYVFGYGGNYFFRGINGEFLPMYILFNTTKLNWEQKIGYHPVLVNELVWRLMNPGNGEASRFDDVTVWDLFQDLCKKHGIIYKFNFEGNDINISGNQYFRIVMHVSFRDTGFSNNNITLDFKTHKQGYKKDEQVNKWQFFKMAEERGDANVVFGEFFNGTNVIPVRGKDWYIAEGGYIEVCFKDNENYRIQDEHYPYFNTFNIPVDEVNEVTFSKYFDCRFFTGSFPFNANQIIFTNDTSHVLDGVFAQKNYSFPAMWTKVGYQYQDFGSFQFFITIKHADDVFELQKRLWANIPNQYKFLLGAFRRILNVKATLLKSFNINLFDKTIVGDYEYVLQRLRNLDLQNRDVDTEWVEVRNIRTRE